MQKLCGFLLLESANFSAPISVKVYRIRAANPKKAGSTVQVFCSHWATSQCRAVWFLYGNICRWRSVSAYLLFYYTSAKTRILSTTNQQAWHRCGAGPFLVGSDFWCKRGIHNCCLQLSIRLKHALSAGNIVQPLLFKNLKEKENSV